MKTSRTTFLIAGLCCSLVSGWAQKSTSRVSKDEQRTSKDRHGIERTAFQTAGPWKPTTDVRSDVA
ncbi:MAG: hypothetical protein ACRCS7_00705, partial [Tannerellaceae bacterium]